MSGALYDTRIPSHVKAHIYKNIVLPAMMYGMETVSMNSYHMIKLEVT